MRPRSTHSTKSVETPPLVALRIAVKWKNPFPPARLQGRLGRRRDVAQPGRALGLGPRRRRFKSCRPDHFSPALQSLAGRTAF